MEYIAAGAGGVALLLAILLLVARGGRRKARALAQGLERRLTASNEAIGTARAGEREAVWALSEARSVVSSAVMDRDAALKRIHLLEGDLDDLKRRLAEADADLTAARRDADEARTEIARLETRTLGDDAATDETNDLRARIEELSVALEAERSTVGLLRTDVATGGDDTDDDYRARLVSSEARRRDLEDRLASLNAVRAAEQRASADRIASLERLHLRIGEDESRIEELEAELKTAEEARDGALEEASRLQVELVRLKGELADAQRRLTALESDAAALTQARAAIEEMEARLAEHSATTAEVERLRKSLDAERSRAERIARRATETTADTTYAMWDRVVRERVDAAVARETARLEQQVAHLRTVVAEKEERLRRVSEGTGQTTDPEPPSITAIKGIGPKIAAILADAGVTSVADVAALTDADIDRLGALMPVYPGRIRDDDWVGQARSFL